MDFAPIYMIRKAGGMRLGAWSGAAESPYATGDYRKQHRDGDAAVGGLDLTRCGRYDSTGPKNNGKLSMCLSMYSSFTSSCEQAREKRETDMIQGSQHVSLCLDVRRSADQ